MLITARTNANYWHQSIFPFAREIRFMRGKVNFPGYPEGKGLPMGIALLVVQGAESMGSSSSFITSPVARVLDREGLLVVIVCFCHRKCFFFPHSDMRPFIRDLRPFRKVHELFIYPRHASIRVRSMGGSFEKMLKFLSSEPKIKHPSGQDCSVPVARKAVTEEGHEGFAGMLAPQGR